MFESLRKAVLVGCGQLQPLINFNSRGFNHKLGAIFHINRYISLRPFLFVYSRNLRSNVTTINI